MDPPYVVDMAPVVGIIAVPEFAVVDISVVINAFPDVKGAPEMPVVLPVVAGGEFVPVLATNSPVVNCESSVVTLFVTREDGPISAVTLLVVTLDEVPRLVTLLVVTGDAVPMLVVTLDEVPRKVVALCVVTFGPSHMRIAQLVKVPVEAPVTSETIRVQFP